MTQGNSDWYLPLNKLSDLESLAQSDPPSPGAKPSAPCQNLCDPARSQCIECGVPGEDEKHKYAASCLREKIKEAAEREWRNWRLAWEREPSHFGYLVEYWLSVTKINNNELKKLRGQFSNKNWNGRIFLNLPVANPVSTNDEENAKTALQQAKQSHFDWESGGQGNMPWSAAFVVACVRSVEIDYGINYELLMRSRAHIEYTLEASHKKPNRYQTIKLTDEVKVGDIIVQDRRTEFRETPESKPRALLLSDVVQLSDGKRSDGGKKKLSAITHGDIVVAVEKNYVITIGGNLEFEPDFDQSGSVRKRKFPTVGGALVINGNTQFEQEKGKSTGEKTGLFPVKGKDGRITEELKTYFEREKRVNDEHLGSLRSEYLEYTLLLDGRSKKDPYKLGISASNLLPLKERLVGSLHSQSTGRIMALLRLKLKAGCERYE